MLLDAGLTSQSAFLVRAAEHYCAVLEEQRGPQGGQALRLWNFFRVPLVPCSTTLPAEETCPPTSGVFDLSAALGSTRVFAWTDRVDYRVHGLELRYFKSSDLGARPMIEGLRNAGSPNWLPGEEAHDLRNFLNIQYIPQALPRLPVDVKFGLPQADLFLLGSSPSATCRLAVDLICGPRT